MNSAFHIAELQNSVQIWDSSARCATEIHDKKLLFPWSFIWEIKSRKNQNKIYIIQVEKETDFRVQKSNLAILKQKWETEPDDNSITTPHHKTPTSLNIPTHSTWAHTISELNFLTPKRGGRLQTAIPTPTGPISFALCFQVPKYFQSLCYIFINFTFVSSFNKSTMSSKNLLSALKNSPSSKNVKSRAIFNIQWNYLNAKSFTIPFEDPRSLASGMLSLPLALWLCTDFLAKEALDPTRGISHITTQSASLQHKSPRTAYITADKASLTSEKILGKHTVPCL